MGRFGLVEGVTPNGASDVSEYYEQAILLLNPSGGSPGHAVIITGNSYIGTYNYYDPQSGSHGTISVDDPRIHSTYGV